MTALSQREVGKVVQGLVEVLSCLHIMLDNCSLKRSFESIEATVGSLVILTHLETTFSVLDLSSARRDRTSDVATLAVNAYLGLAKLCSPLHGEGGGGVYAVLKGLLPGVPVCIYHYCRYAHSEKSSNRLFSLEVVGRLMYTVKSVEVEAEENTPEVSTIHPPPTEVSSASVPDPSSVTPTPSSPQGSSTPATIPPTTLPSQHISDSFLFASIYATAGVGMCLPV